MREAVAVVRKVLAEAADLIATALRAEVALRRTTAICFSEKLQGGVPLVLVHSEWEQN